jgi:N-acyl-D-aspartate/D-glutamate deacylase
MINAFLSVLVLSCLSLSACSKNSESPSNHVQGGAQSSAQYDLAINGGTVIDPATSTRQLLNVGINDGVIVTLSESPLAGRDQIDASDKIVSPGFIDLHTHTPFPFGEELQLRDGVTTALDLEAGAFPIAEYGRSIKDNALANYGSSVGHYAIRIKVIEQRDQPYLVSESGALTPGAAFTQPATSEQVAQMREMINEVIDLGGIGIGFLLDYMSGAVTNEELQMIFDVAKSRDVAIWAHIRRGVNGDIQPLHDLLNLAKTTGAKLHICHINANAMGEIANWLNVIDQANAEGADVTVEVFPYTAGSTSISANVFDRDWQTIFDISYEDVQWAETGEFFTKESWEETRKSRPDGMIIHHYMNEDWLKVGLQYPNMIIASDAMPALSAENKAAPNGAGSFTRLLAHYARDLKLLSLEEAIAKGSYLPA